MPDNKPSGQYRLMIYFALSTMFLYNKTIHHTKEMTPEEFYKENEDVMKRVCEEAENIFEYELSYNQKMKACYCCLQAIYKPQSVYEKEAFVPS
jgi:hypothetical protein